MSRQTEIFRLQRLAIEKGGYVAKLCQRCGWWQCTKGDRNKFEQDYSQDIRCKCMRG